MNITWQQVNRVLSNDILVELPAFRYFTYRIFCFSQKTNKQTNKHPQQNKSKAGGLLLIKLLGSLYVSGEQPSYPSPKPALTLTSHLGQNVRLGEG